MAAAKSAKTTTRKDPAPRHLGVMPWFELEEDDPTRKFVWVSKDVAQHLPGGQGWYALNGYDYVIAEAGGVKPRGVKVKEGEAIEVGGMLLMSIDRAEYNAQIAGAQRAADVRERQMIKKTGKYDPMRGLGNMNNRYGDPYVSADVDIAPLRQELGGLRNG